MKKKSKRSNIESDELRPEYDFRNAIRGKHYQSLQKGYTVHIHQADGSTVVEHYKLVDGAIMLQADVREYFPDSDSVNKALRSLIALIAAVPERQQKHRQSKIKPKVRA